MFILKKVYNPQKELIRRYRLELKKRINHFRNAHVRRYINACYDQAIEFTNNYYNATLETSPLLGFYAVLNLTKVHVIINSASKIINMDEINKKFRTHGASSPAIEKIRFSKSGTFIEMAKFYYSNFVSKAPKEITLHQLYKNFVELSDIYISLYKQVSNFIKVGYLADLLKGKYIDTDPADKIGLYTGKEFDNEFHHILGKDWQFFEKENKSCAEKSVKPNQKLSEYKKILHFSLDDEVFILRRTNENEYLNEQIVIYLLFLKYSSLVRYQPKNWNEKLRSKEYSIIDKFSEVALVKFWSLIYNEIMNDIYYII